MLPKGLAPPVRLLEMSWKWKVPQLICDWIELAGILMTFSIVRILRVSSGVRCAAA